MHVVVNIRPEDLEALADWIHRNTRPPPDTAQPYEQRVRAVAIPEEGGFSWLDRARDFYEAHYPELLSDSSRLTPWTELTVQQQLDFAADLGQRPQWVFPELGPVDYAPAPHVAAYILRQAA